MEEFDLIIIGSGSGGSASANRAAERGAKVAVIEAGVLAGTCVNRGCVPKKLTWYASRVAEAIHRFGPGYGFDTDKVSFDYHKFLESRDGYVGRSRASYGRNFEKNRVYYIEGYAQLLGQGQVQVGEKTYQAKYIVLATGSRPSELEVPGHELLDNSDDFFKWTDLPKSVAVVGAGYIAVELSQALHGLGVETHLVVRHDRPLRTFDKMVTDELVEMMAKNGPELHPYTNFDAYKQNESGQIECYQDGKLILTVDRVIQAIGRRPNTENLGLEQTSIKLDDKGFIEVDENHQTGEENVFALGDVIHRPQLTPVAIKAGRSLAEYLFNDGPSGAMDYTNIPTVVFSHPTIGMIGLTEDQAKKEFGTENIKVYTNRFFSMYASGGLDREACHFKLVCQGPDETVVGLHAIGEGVDEMIQGFGVAMKMKATKADFDSVVAIHPTGAEEFVTMR
ncbi:glutathione-disulfide reductase [Eremococcus coleocola]|uniref:glutathione-disulfide reductase n=1 Tax=Eremococcus coleocola TaxID=88132 RepID=UPI0003F5B1A3|nr:glutathione-disulfide reductase [Eremococcus coleocola]